MSKIVYITGCLGFMGSHVTEACLKKGWYVMGVDKCTYAADISLIDHWAAQYTNQFKFIIEKWSPIAIATFEASIMTHGKKFNEIHKLVI